jgi:hypothetical protein
MWQCSDVARAISTVRSTVLRTVDTGSHSHALACDLIVRRAFFRVAVSSVRVSVVAGVCVVLLVVRSTPYWVNPAAVHLGVFDKQRGAPMPVCMGAKQASKQESKKAGKQGSKRANKGACASGPLLSLDSGDPENLPFHIALFSSHFNHYAHPPGGPPMLGRAIDRSVGLPVAPAHRTKACITSRTKIFRLPSFPTPWTLITTSQSSLVTGNYCHRPQRVHLNLPRLLTLRPYFLIYAVPGAGCASCWDGERTT